MRWLRLIPALLCLLICAGFRPAHAQTFSLQTGREPIVSLDGLWRFHTGDNPQWANTNFDDSQWPLLRSDRPWTDQGYLHYGGYAWYRFTVEVPDGNKPLGLLLTRIGTGYQVYANGERIGSAGTTAPTRDPSLNYPPEVFRIPTGSAGPQTIQIALRVWSYQPFASWIVRDPADPGSAVGDPILLAQRLHQTRNAFALRFVNTYAYGLLAALVGLTILGLFWFHPEDREYLWFAVLLLAQAADTALNIIVAISSIPYPLYWLLSDIAAGLSVIAALAFFSIVLDVRRSFWWWVACIAATASPLTTAMIYFEWTGITICYAAWLGCLLPASIWIVVQLAIGARRKNVSARLLLAPAALFYGFTVIDSILFISWDLGWQRTLSSLEVPLLQRLFPLGVADLIHYIFILALLIFLVRRFSLARQEETRLSTEMEAARGVQSLLVPATPPNTPGFAVESVYIPASEVGGDFFQVLPGSDGSLLVVMGDVSGKGLKAAMTVSTIVGALSDEKERRPAALLAHLNRVLHGKVGGFVTCCATLIASDGKLTIANAGHLSPYRNGEELAVAGGLPLGILDQASYEEMQHELARGDRLTFLSDGVVEARNIKGELYGFARTQRISNQPAAAIAEAAKQFGQEDDITVLNIQYL